MPDIKIIMDDCMNAFKQLPSASIDAVITDPPYFLDQLKTEWDENMLDNVTKNSRVSSLPGGMKFDPKQGKEFQKFMGKVSEEVMRVLKPGGFYLSFTAPRLTHRLGVAIEDEGFHIRDLWGWLYTQNQVKAMSVNHFMEKRKDIKPEQKEALREILKVWKTPQIKSCIEPIVCAQKPPEGTFLDNWILHGVGLVNSSCKIGTDKDMFPSNILTAEKITSTLDRVFLVPKPKAGEKGAASKHVSVKPVSLMAHLIALTTQEGATILDPFNGSGSTGIAAVLVNRNYIGFEVNKEYFDITQKRFKENFKNEKKTYWSEGLEGHKLVFEGEVSPFNFKDN